MPVVTTAHKRTTFAQTSPAHNAWGGANPMNSLKSKKGEGLEGTTTVAVLERQEDPAAWEVM